MKIYQVELWICEYCLRGQGDECHVPDCALCRNRCPDIGIAPECCQVLDHMEVPDKFLSVEDHAVIYGREQGNRTAR